MARELPRRARGFLDGGRKVRLVALDMDGTLLERGSAISDGNAAAVRAAVAAGVRIVLATSRWYVLAKRTADLLGITAPLICHNGALIRGPHDDAPLLDLLIPAGTAREIARVADEAGYEGMVTVDNVTYLAASRAEGDPSRLPAGIVLTQRLSAHAADGVQAFLFFGQEAVDGVGARLDGRHDGALTLARGYSETFPPYLNIVHGDADKGRALLMVCEHLGIDPGDAMAIGDAAPDLEMMRVAGLSVAMGNAPPEVRAEVEVVAPGNREDGVAWAIRRFAL